jgi:hypothetical protein
LLLRPLARFPLFPSITLVVLLRVLIRHLRAPQRPSQYLLKSSPTPLEPSSPLPVSHLPPTFPPSALSPTPRAPLRTAPDSHTHSLLSMTLFPSAPERGAVPVFNSASPWASSGEDLKALWDCEATSAVTTRTCTLNGFDDDASKHQVRFLPMSRFSSSYPSCWRDRSPDLTATNGSDNAGHFLRPLRPIVVELLRLLPFPSRPIPQLYPPLPLYCFRATEEEQASHRQHHRHRGGDRSDARRPASVRGGAGDRRRGRVQCFVP